MTKVTDMWPWYRVVRLVRVNAERLSPLCEPATRVSFYPCLVL